MRLLQRRQRLTGGRDGVPTGQQTCSQVGSVGGALEAAVLQLGERREEGEKFIPIVVIINNVLVSL